MAYQSKYTGLQIDDILDSVEYKQNQIEDLASIRAGAQKGATALQSYTEKYTGTVTGIKINGTVKSGSGVIDLGTITTVTESTVSGWGFTKNAGTYSKPSGGIPKSDLASAVQTSLGKADTALQSHQDISGKQDKLVSGTNIKTINGTSLLGSGNIVISGGGGSSSGSGAYAEVNHGTSDTTFTLTPNTFHVWDEVSALTLTLGSETAGVANEYLFQFTSGATVTSLTLPDDIKWTEELVIEMNRIYQVSILKGLASVLSWESEPKLIENKFHFVANKFNYYDRVVFEYPVASKLCIEVPSKQWFVFVYEGDTEGVSGEYMNGIPSPDTEVIISPTEDVKYKYVYEA